MVTIGEQQSCREAKYIRSDTGTTVQNTGKLYLKYCTFFFFFFNNSVKVEFKIEKMYGKFSEVIKRLESLSYGKGQQEIGLFSLAKQSWERI